MADKLAIFPEFSVFSNPKIRAIAALAIALLAFAFVPIFVRLGENEISPTAVIFNRLWIAALILAFAKGFLKIFNKHRHKNNQSNSSQFYTVPNMALLLITGLFFVAPQITWALSITQTSIANSALLHNFTPIFVAIAGFIVFGQRFDRKFLIGMIIAIIGSIVLGVDDFLSETGKIQGDSLALLSALCLAIYLLFVQRLQNRLDVLSTVLYCCLIGVLTSFPLLLGNINGIFPSSWIGWLSIVGLGWTICIGYGFMSYALNFLSSEFVAVMMLLDPILTSIFAWIIFSESLDFYNFLAFPIILLGIYLAVTSASGTNEYSLDY